MKRNEQNVWFGNCNKRVTEKDFSQKTLREDRDAYNILFSKSQQNTKIHKIFSP
jgi:hypothetical protein